MNFGEIRTQYLRDPILTRTIKEVMEHPEADISCKRVGEAGTWRDYSWKVGESAIESGKLSKFKAFFQKGAHNFKMRYNDEYRESFNAAITKLNKAVGTETLKAHKQMVIKTKQAALEEVREELDQLDGEIEKLDLQMEIQRRQLKDAESPKDSEKEKDAKSKNTIDKLQDLLDLLNEYQRKAKEKPGIVKGVVGLITGERSLNDIQRDIAQIAKDPKYQNLKNKTDQLEVFIDEVQHDIEELKEDEREMEELSEQHKEDIEARLEELGKQKDALLERLEKLEDHEEVLRGEIKQLRSAQDEFALTDESDDELSTLSSESSHHEPDELSDEGAEEPLSDAGNELAAGNVEEETVSVLSRAGMEFLSTTEGINSPAAEIMGSLFTNIGKTLGGDAIQSFQFNPKNGKGEIVLREPVRVLSSANEDTGSVLLLLGYKGDKPTGKIAFTLTGTKMEFHEGFELFLKAPPPEEIVGNGTDFASKLARRVLSGLKTIQVVVKSIDTERAPAEVTLNAAYKMIKQPVSESLDGFCQSWGSGEVITDERSNEAIIAEQ